MEIQNLFNTVNLAQPSTNTDPDPNPANNTIDARNFGKINGTNGNAVQRNVQFAFRFAF
jgi:hypothetical protein